MGAGARLTLHGLCWAAGQDMLQGTVQDALYLTMLTRAQVSWSGVKNPSPYDAVAFVTPVTVRTLSLEPSLDRKPKQLTQALVLQGAYNVSPRARLLASPVL